jgi:hypothetical protein
MTDLENKIRACFPLNIRDTMQVEHRGGRVYVHSGNSLFDVEKLKSVVGAREVVQVQSSKPAIFRGECEVVICH